MLTTVSFLAHATDIRWQRNKGFALLLDHLSIGSGARVALIGGNGSGKSSVLELLAGLSHADSGEVTLFGSPPDTAATRRRLGVQTPLVNYNHLLKVEDLVRLHRALHRTVDTEIGASLGIPELAGRLIGALSQGQRRRVDLYLAFAHAPALLLLDEPTAGLDAERRLTFLRLCDEAMSRGASIVTATHDPGEVEAADEVCWFRRGRLRARAEPRTLLRDVVGSFMGEIVYAGEGEASAAEARIGTLANFAVHRHGAMLRIAGEEGAAAAFDALLATSSPLRTSRGDVAAGDLLNAICREDGQ